VKNHSTKANRKVKNYAGSDTPLPKIKRKEEENLGRQ
jgi:hypothetical protein